MGEEGDEDSNMYKVESEKEDNEEVLRHRGILKLDQLNDSTAYWAALTTITQVLTNSFKTSIMPAKLSILDLS